MDSAIAAEHDTETADDAHAVADDPNACHETIEINFQLDANGRTTSGGTTNNKNEYTTRIFHTRFTSPERGNDDDDLLYQELLVDCEIADSGLMPRTFWIAATAPPRCTLEHMAKAIFQQHTQGMAASFDPATAGAEWWVQIRPSPEKTGRYAMHTNDVTNIPPPPSIDFHWDKDEELRILCGGTTYVHPHWSTVTYLTSVGAPTLIAEDQRVDNLTGEWLVASNDSNGDVVLSWPSRGKHLCFDGRFLHGAPHDLTWQAASHSQRRYTFLVNIWLHHRPLQVFPFPETMLSKVSGHDGAAKASCRPRLRLKFLSSQQEEDVTPGNDVAIPILHQKNTSPEQVHNTWPLGDDGSFLSMKTTTSLLQADLRQRSTTFRLQWPAGNPPGVVLQKPTDDRPQKHTRDDDDNALHPRKK